MCKGLGRREDADVRVFIDSLAAGHASKTALETEVLLRWLLSSSLDANPQEQSLHRWLAANASSVDMLMDRIDQWKNPQLRGVLSRLAVIAKSAQGMHAIMAVGSGVVGELERSRRADPITGRGPGTGLPGGGAKLCSFRVPSRPAHRLRGFPATWCW